jgi:hypothetical protein
MSDGLLAAAFALGVLLCILAPWAYNEIRWRRARSKRSHLQVDHTMGHVRLGKDRRR